MPANHRHLKLNQSVFRNAATKRAFNRRLFSEVAPAYDRVTAWLSFGQDATWKKLLARSLPATVHPAILDLACGTGDITLALAARYPAGRVLGMDLNPAMLERARLRCENSRISLRLGDMNRTGLKSGEFDFVTGGYALRNAPDLKNTLKEIYRLLKKGGRGAFLDFSKSPQPSLQAISLGLLKFWGSLWGLILHGNPDIYAYLAESLRHFPDRAQFKHLLAETGFRVVSSRILFFGFIELVVFEK
jgi:demethylmenaquinone methyltransferase/2-methoxy-6-polyprenyl-1,4-benzoquinol methylase